MTFSKTVLVAFFAFAAACGGSDESSGLGNTCPPASPPTYDSFVQSFMTSYCLNCHSATKTAMDRRGAPEGLNFDTAADVMNHLDAIEAVSAAGPNASNVAMPPGMRKPTDDERRQLGEFIECSR